MLTTADTADTAAAAVVTAAAAAAPPTVQVEEPAKRKGGVILGSVAELVEKLHKEAKVI
jgi:hypothetical protein